MYSLKKIIKIILFFSIMLVSYNILYAYQASNISIKTTSDLIINQNLKTITTNKYFLLIDKLNKFSGHSLTIWYQALNKLNLNDINRIEANTNLKIEIGDNTKISADKYIYSNKANVHTLIAQKNNIVYEDSLRTLTTKDRIEYFIKENIIVIRGNPKIVGRYHQNSATYYDFSANLINIQLADDIFSNNNNNGSNNIVFIEAIKNVFFKENDITIKADYAIYYQEHNQIEFFDNVSFTTRGSNVTGDAAIYNLNSGLGKIISNDKKRNIKGKYQPKN